MARNTRLATRIAVGVCLLAARDPARAIEQRVEAYIGRPFGVARAILPVAPTDDRTSIETNGYTLDDVEGRVLYPAFTTHRFLALLREVIGARPVEQPRSITVWFLFRGDEPFAATVYTPEPQRIVVRPVVSERRFRRFLDDWWRQYVTAAKIQKRFSDYPPIAETYLTTMLSQRLGVDSDELLRGQGAASPFSNELLQLALNLESLHVDTLRRKMQSIDTVNQPLQPLPDELPWPDGDVAGRIADDVQIEPIAHRVPRECFYIRFGSFQNYLWLKHLLEENGGSLARMIALRGHDTMLGQNAQQQLGLKESALAKVLGSQVISDVALIGHDTYLRDGAAIGILFQAKNGSILGAELLGQRRDAMQALAIHEPRLETVKIRDRDVSFASTADNRLRSFHVSDGDFHLVTNCRKLAERFLETASGVNSLGSTADFRSIRSELPLRRDDSVFIYLSRNFFQGLLSPRYQIELRRRLDSVVEMELLSLARLAARNEGISAEDPDELIRHGFLPEGFGVRADQSGIVESRHGLIDSRRGARGFFTPIPDVEVSEVTPSELQTLHRIEDFRKAHWQDMDPLTVAVKRFATDDPSLEKIRFTAWMVPFDREKYGTLSSVVGPPSKTIIRQPPDSIISGQLSIQGGRLLPSADPHILFFGLQDVEMPTDVRRARALRTLQVLRTAPAYLGAWPKPGLLDLLPTAPEEVSAAGEIARLPFGLWRWQSPDGFAIVSFDLSVLQDTAPHVGVDQARSEGQIRLHVGDISKAKIRGWFNALNYQRAYETSIGNTKFLLTLHQQLGVDKSDAKNVAEQLLGVKLICPLGGEYLLVARNGHTYWESTGWENGTSESRRAEFQSSVADWFRGLEARVTLTDDRIVAHGLLDVRREEQDASLKLPIFEWIRNNPFGSGEESGRPQPVPPKPQ
jgi:hypothetical protein